jgi:hypothetical protein
LLLLVVNLWLVALLVLLLLLLLLAGGMMDERLAVVRVLRLQVVLLLGKGLREGHCAVQVVLRILLLELLLLQWRLHLMLLLLLLQLLLLRRRSVLLHRRLWRIAGEGWSLEEQKSFINATFTRHKQLTLWLTVGTGTYVLGLLERCDRWKITSTASSGV